MKYIKRFNESINEDNTNQIITLTADDVKRMDSSLFKDYNLNDDVLTVEPAYHDNSSKNWNGKKVNIGDLLNGNHQIGFAILLDGKVEHLTSIYEPHGFEFNEKRGLVTVYGHEEIVLVWLDNGEKQTILTR